MSKRRRENEAAVPIAKRMQQSADLPFVVAKPANDDIEDQIKALEAQLDSSSSDESDDNDDDTTPTSNDDAHIVNLSAYQHDIVPALPSAQLPKAHSFQANASRSAKSTPPSVPKQKIVGKVPFACKPCGFVGKDLADFQAHKASGAHNDVVGTTAQRLSCQLCAKDFTSADQLAEHKLGKWHLMRKRTKKEHFHDAVRVCYDFMRGNCFRGDACSFGHAATNAKHQTIQKPTRHCTQFVAGTCKFGDQCIFIHQSS
ncbi:hypothetical protein H257_07989 [Aphanomyces astaci]|uniref:C3H1-type domain-containing protein n=1 Tax=Aphanomyces astaci TaxID=112090 RepID=W4GFJ5_APHAT|nr:hypothetical protein H257_07989 [Aphanomyces astaci]ETV78462.1 hypothetical protein H257_07989 [Aphanomyces astaci]RQM24530.1 hypothetical protein B5M09_001387 [Aphanomyces astaci]|eukprot:XP_009832043.1 hypothetical protein H257_07989 [Aphanomyces astaci]